MELTKKNATQTYEVKSENYALTATAQYEIGKGVNSISGGVVRTDEKMVASFSMANHYIDGKLALSVSFTVDYAEQPAILAEINAFVDAIVADVNA